MCWQRGQNSIGTQLMYSRLLIVAYRWTNISLIRFINDIKVVPTWLQNILSMSKQNEEL